MLIWTLCFYIAYLLGIRNVSSMYRTRELAAYLCCSDYTAPFAFCTLG